MSTFSRIKPANRPRLPMVSIEFGLFVMQSTHFFPFIWRRPTSAGRLALKGGGSRVAAVAQFAVYFTGRAKSRPGQISSFRRLGARPSLKLENGSTHEQEGRGRA